jgi:hypothetical protein
MRGNVVAVLLGCSSAMVFRPGPNNTYQVIGEAYLGGFVEFQALLDPLPKPFEHIRFYSERDRMWWDVCFNRQKRLVQVEDPRLGPLPGYVKKMLILRFDVFFGKIN